MEYFQDKRILLLLHRKQKLQGNIPRMKHKFWILQRKLNLQDKQRNEERRDRFAKMNKEDRKLMDFYKLTLDDLNEEKELVEYDPSKEQQGYMRRAKDETADLDDTPEWPSLLDPVKRESMHVLKDLIGLTEDARLAGLIK